LISLIIVLFVAISLNSILATSLSINKVKFSNNLSSLCTISIITCLDNISSIQKEDSDVKKQTELILEQVKSNHIENVAYWIKNELETLCENRVFFQNFTQRDDNQTFQLKNIICSLKDSTESFPENNSTIIIGAHYDSRAENINNSEARAPGADDNASGVSAILELVRILSHVNLKLNLELVLFSGEEQGKWGSNNYVKYLDNNITKNIDLYINFDMIGYRPSNESNKVILEYDVGNKHVQNDNYSKTIALFIKHIASTYTNLQTQLAKLGNSDFLSFEALGITVIGIHDEGVTENPNYHKSSDTPNTLNIKYATSITKMMLATILEIDKLSQSIKSN
jgi:hypothetical protein